MKPTKIDYDYYDWLVSQIDIPNGKGYNQLFERLHNVEFVWIVPNDHNRLQDGIDLRYLFLNDLKDQLKLQGATVLEVIVALSRRMEFTAGGNSRKWAWKFLKHIKLTKMSDPLTDEDLDIVDGILEALIWRTYKPNGEGGFFPLKYPAEDQTKVEIWYQMNAYVIEKNLL